MKNLLKCFNNFYPFPVITSDNELVVHPSADRDYSISNPESESADSKHNIVKPSPNGSNRKSRRAVRSFKCEICGK